MRYLILSDIHGNWEALHAVLEASAEEDVDQVLVLGDLVGYGAGPNEVVDKVRDIGDLVIRGNHDRVAVEEIGAESFNSVALAAVRWTADTLSTENARYLRHLESGPVEFQPGVSICHGSPLDEDQYIVSLDAAEEVFRDSLYRVIFYGHTHLPMIFVESAAGVRGAALEEGELVLTLDPANRYLVNPGSVGQPRDRNPLAAYMIFDSDQETITWRRCEYEIESAQRRILEAGLPQVLAYRLAAGI